MEEINNLQHHNILETYVGHMLIQCVNHKITRKEGQGSESIVTCLPFSVQDDFDQSLLVHFSTT